MRAWLLRNQATQKKTFVSSVLVLWSLLNPNPFPKQQNLDSSKLKEFVDDNFGFDESRRELANTVENTVGKGKIAHKEQFCFFP